MVKRAQPWLRGLARAVKLQRRTLARAVEQLLAVPKAKPRPKAAATPRVRAAVAPKPRAAASEPRAAAPALPATGQWFASYYGFASRFASRFASHDAGSAAPGARRMRYWLYLPDGAVPAAGLPLLVMLHGCDQSAAQFAEGTRMNQLAGKAGYALLYPQQSLGTHPHRCWKWYDRATQQGGGDVPTIVGLIGTVAQRYPVDAARIYICGMSAGAGMANIVALNHPELFAGLGLHSGPMFGAGHSAAGALAVMRHGAVDRVDSAIGEVLARRAVAFPPLPTILIQGEADTVVRPINQAQLARQAMLVNRLPAASAVAAVVKPGSRRGHAYQVNDVRRGRQLLLRVARVAGLQHAWSGGDARLAFNSGAGPDASKMLLNFFARQRRA